MDFSLSCYESDGGHPSFPHKPLEEFVRNNLLERHVHRLRHDLAPKNYGGFIREMDIYLYRCHSCGRGHTSHIPHKH